MTVSVVIPAFDAAGTLVETLDSVLAQTSPPREVIVVDDGSADATAEIAGNHPLRPRIVPQASAGAAAAINRGVRETSGAYIAVLDSDDLWDPDWLRQASEALARENVSAVFGRLITFLDPGLSVEEAARLRYQREAEVGFLLGACLFKRDVFTSLGGLDPGLRTGYFIDFYHRFAFAGHKTCTISGVGLRRRIRNGSLTRRATEGPSLAEQRLTRDFLKIARAAINRRKVADELKR